MVAFLAFALALVVTVVLLPIAARRATAHGLVDEPGDRRVHVGTIPKSGGLALIAGVAAGLLPSLPYQTEFSALLFALLLVAALGFVDDRQVLRARYKLLGQALCALIVIAAYGPIAQFPLLGTELNSPWFAVPLTILFLAGITNAVNMSDGVDGLAAGSSVLSFLLLAVFAYQAGDGELFVLTLALVGALLGFLRFNTHPARVFLGDSGSHLLGFGAAVVCVLLIGHANVIASPAVPLLMFALPIFDAAMVIVLRYRAGVSIFKADNRHVHHQLMAAGFRHGQVVALMYVLQAIAVGLAYGLRFESDAVVLLVFSAYCAAVALALFMLSTGRWKVSPPRPAADRRNPGLRRLAWYHRRGHVLIAAALGALLMASAFFVVPTGEIAPSIYGVAVLVVVSLWWSGKLPFPWPQRLAIVSAVAIIVFCFFENMHNRPVFNAAVDVSLLILAAALVVGMLVTRRAVFKLDNGDYLLLLVLASAPLLVSGMAPLDVARVVLRLVVMLYAAEFVLARGERASQALSALSMCTIAILGLRSW